jgi:ABC-type glycerol-3-phosphate transport system substrate-binding protein
MGARSRQRRNRRASLIALSLVVALIAAACGDSTDETEAGDAAATTAAAGGDIPEEVLAAAAAAEARGQRFVTSREELLRLAEEEGALHVQFSPPSDDDADRLLNLFMEKYPFITATGDHLGGSGRAQYLLELKGGAGRSVDVIMVGLEAYEEYDEWVTDWDVYGMAEAGILDIPLEMIDPIGRSVVSQVTSAATVIYNTELIDESEIPDDWFGFLDEKFNSENLGLVANVEAQNDSVLVAALGEERVYEYAAGIAALDPIWVDSQNTGAQLVLQGEAAVYPLMNTHTAYLNVAAAEEAGNPILATKDIEPIPVRITELNAVASFAEHPYAALLWLEHASSVEAQAEWDAIAPPQTSLWSPYESPTSMVSYIAGRQTSVVDFEHARLVPSYVAGILEAEGFPTAQG